MEPGLFMRTVRTSRYNRVRVAVAGSPDADAVRAHAKWQAIVPPAMRSLPPLQWTAHGSSESCDPARGA